MKTKFKKIIRNIYLYTFSAVGLIIFITGAIGLLNVCMKTYVFPLAHYEEYYYDSCYEGKYRLAPDTTELTEEQTAECEEEREVSDSDARKRDLAIGVSQIFVGTPLWLYHWTVIQRRKKED
ncbi:MAG: hypothetical protein ABII07_01720 [Patescibacteria group bacterium]|nr:hypothetical protein [Patescibacteria group bacterium]